MAEFGLTNQKWAFWVFGRFAGLKEAVPKKFSRRTDALGELKELQKGSKLGVALVDVEEDGRDACLGDISERLDSPRCDFFFEFLRIAD